MWPMAQAPGRRGDDVVRRRRLSPTMAQCRSVVELLAVEGDDAAGLLAAVLQGVQAERGQRGGVGMAEDAEDAALLAQLVVIEGIGGQHGTGPRRAADGGRPPSLSKQVRAGLVNWHSDDLE